MAGIGGAAAAFRTMIDETSQAQSVAAQTAAVLKSTGGAAGITAQHLTDLAGAMSQKVAVDDDAIQSAGNVLLTFTGLRNEVGKNNDVFDQTLSLTADMSRAFGGDMNKAAIQLGKALNDPVKGVSALARVGVTFTDSQKKQIKSLVESGNLVGAQKIVLAELRKEIGGSAAAYGKTLPGSIEKMKIAFGNFMAEIGTKLIPVLTRLSAWVVKFSNLSPGVKKMILAMVGIVAVAMAVKKVTLAFQALRIAMLANPFMLVATVAITAGILIVTHWKQVKGFLIGAWNTVKRAFWSVAHTIQNAARSGFLGPAGWIITHFRQVVNFFKGLPSRLGGYARRAGRAIWNGIKSGASGVLGFVKGIFNGVMSHIERGINGIIGGVNHAIDLFNKLPGRDIGHIGNVSLPRLAQGGIVTRPTIAMIGEAGPEAVVPLSRNKRARGQAVAAAAGIGGGNTNYFTINTTGGVDEVALARSIGWQLATRGLA
jgi:hypothetical protein